MIDVPDLIHELISPYCSPLPPKMVPLDVFFIDDLTCTISIYGGEGESMELEKEVEIYWIGELLRIQIWHWVEDLNITNKKSRPVRIDPSDFYNLYVTEELDRLSARLGPLCQDKTVKIIYYEEITI